MKVTRFGHGAWSLEPDQLPSNAIDRARVLASLAKRLGDARDPVVGSRSVLVLGDDPAPLLDAMPARPDATPLGTEHVIPVAYDGPDLADVATATGLSIDAVIARHAEATYTAVLCGFLPGFAYLAELPAELRVARRSAPRAKVTPRSVGIAGPYTGVYPSASPGGWNLLGEAMPSDLFDPARVRPPLVNLLDRVRFEQVDRRAFERSNANPDTDALHVDGARAGAEGAAEIAITRVAGLATFVDRGRPAHRRFGVPLGGPLDRESYVELSRTCEVNTVLELLAGSIELTVTRGSTWFATNGEAARLLRTGDVARFEAKPSLTRLIALGGEPRVAPVLGSRSSILGFAWAGRLGRPLAKGDAITIDEVARMPTDVARSFDAHDVSETTLAFEPMDDNAAASLDGARLEIGATSSRVGTRLHGLGAVASSGTPSGESHPMVPGAIQQTPDGTLILLGPDSATLGGYPLVGFLPEQARSELARLRPGRSVRLKV